MQIELDPGKHAFIACVAGVQDSTLPKKLITHFHIAFQIIFGTKRLFSRERERKGRTEKKLSISTRQRLARTLCYISANFRRTVLSREFVLSRIFLLQLFLFFLFLQFSSSIAPGFFSFLSLFLSVLFKTAFLSKYTLFFCRSLKRVHKLYT